MKINIKYFLICFLTIFATTHIPNAQTLDEHLKKANAGDAEAMIACGEFYEFGSKSIEKNPAKAFEFYTKAADKGNAYGIYKLGCCYLDGIGIEKDPKKALELYEKSAKKGCDEALSGIAMIHFFGEGVEKNIKKAISYWKIAAAKNNISSLLCLAHCYEKGEGVEANALDAFKYYKKAANLGNKQAQDSVDRLIVGETEIFKFKSKMDYTKQDPSLGFSYRFSSDFAWVDEYHYASGIKKENENKVVIEHFNQLIKEMDDVVKRGIYKRVSIIEKNDNITIGEKKFVYVSFAITSNDNETYESYLYLTAMDGGYLKYRFSLTESPNENTQKEFMKFIGERLTQLKSQALKEQLLKTMAE